ncbi:MAG: MBL fold metallo-hydrolase [Promethearchaeota archaeon]|jgi:glyoxylase-like metal-dependent hydrolase (beta-lactamase superfamily II)
MKEVYPGIFLIEEKGRFRPSDNIYVLAGNDGLIYDAGYGYKNAVKHFFKEFKEIQRNYKKIFKITRVTVSHGHSDHFSGLKYISETFGIKIILTEKIAETIKDKVSFETNFQGDDYEDYLRVRKKIIRKIWNFLRRLGTNLFFRGIHGLSYLDSPDEIINENSIIQINGEPWKIFPSPGHSPEHISLYNEEKGILFSGDNVLKMRSTWLGPPESNITDYIETIKKIQNLPNLNLILPAHGEVIENPKDNLIAILERMNERQKQVLDAINKHSEKGLSPDDILNLIYPNSKRFIRIIARDWVVLTLKMLEEKEIIKRTIVKKKILFFLT